MSLGTRTSVKIALPALICLLVLLTVAALAVIFYPRIQVELAKLARQNLIGIHARISDQLEQYFDVAERVSQVNRRTSGERMLGWAEMREWRRTLNEELRAFDTLSAIVWGDADGNAIFVARYPGRGGYRFGITDTAAGDGMREYALAEDGSIGAEVIATYAYDPRRRPWYLDALRAGEPAWGEIYMWTEKPDIDPVLSVPYVTPLRDAAGEVRSVMTVEFSLYDIGRYLASLPIGESGLAYIMDARGRLVAASTGTSAQYMGAAERRLATEVEHPLIAASAQAIADGLMGDTIPAGPYQDSLRFNEVDVLFMAAPFIRLGDLRWLVVTLVPEDAFLGGIHAARRHSIAAAIAALLLAILIGIGVGRYISRPIVRLAEHVRLIGRGELDAQIELRGFPEFMRLSVAINRMTEGLRERMQLRESLAMAMEVQQRLLPAATPAIPGLDIAGHSDYCDETGGDYYDFLEMEAAGADTAVVAIGDVSGHGIASAMVMASARGILRSRSHDATSLAELLRHMNRQISEDSTGGRFMTMLLMMISSCSRELRWASAGHRPPLVYEPHADRVEELEGADVPLGVVPGAEYREFSFSNLSPGTVVLLATDGLWEAESAEGGLFGLQRIREHLRRYAARPAQEIAATLTQTVAGFRGGRSQNDDITFVVIKVKE